MPFPSFPEEQLYACGKLQPPQASLLDAIVIFSLQRLGSNRGPFSLQTLTFRWLIDEKGRDDLTQCSVTRVIFQVMILLGEKRTSRNRIQFLHWCLQTLYQTQMYFLPSFLSSWLLSSVLWRDSGPERSREADEWNPSGASVMLSEPLAVFLLNLCFWKVAGAAGPAKADAHLWF